MLGRVLLTACATLSIYSGASAQSISSNSLNTPPKVEYAQSGINKEPDIRPRRLVEVVTSAGIGYKLEAPRGVEPISPAVPITSRKPIRDYDRESRFSWSQIAYREQMIANSRNNSYMDKGCKLFIFQFK